MVVSWLPATKVTEVRVLNMNAAPPMDVTPAGMVIDVRALVSANALSPIDVSWLPDAKVTEVRALVP